MKMMGVSLIYTIYIYIYINDTPIDDDPPNEKRPGILWGLTMRDAACRAQLHATWNGHPS